MTTQVYPGITMDAGVRFGKPCIAGTRIDVATVVGAIGSGDSVEAVQEAYDLTVTRSSSPFAMRLTLPLTCRPPSKKSPDPRCSSRR